MLSHLVVALLGIHTVKLLEEHKIVSKKGYLISGAAGGLFVYIFISAGMLLAPSVTFDNRIVILIASVSIGVIDFLAYYTSRCESRRIK